MREKKLVGYITSAYPDVMFSQDLILSMQEGGLDAIELGLPFSDPVADGEVIEKANLKALENGWRLKDAFELSALISPKIDSYFMGYFNQFFHYGLDKFLQESKHNQLKGFIIPDLPHEQASVFKAQFERQGLSLIDFVAPTDEQPRVKQLVQNSNDFIYLVAYAGITGSGASEDLTQVVEYIKESTDTPIYVGFGVNEHTAKDKVKGVDGVIVGSAFIKVLGDESLNYNQKINKICEIVKKIKQEINK